MESQNISTGIFEPELVAARIRSWLNFRKLMAESDLERVGNCSNVLDEAILEPIGYEKTRLLKSVQRHLEDLERLISADFSLEFDPELEPMADDLKFRIAKFKSELEFKLKYIGILSDTLVESESKPKAVRERILKGIQSGLAKLAKP